jgi:hypothetical protein
VQGDRGDTIALLRFCLTNFKGRISSVARFARLDIDDRMDEASMQLIDVDCEDIGDA